ncbi:DUF3566 domain-containing protein [Geodermatophilus sp. SYSU D01036]
MSDRPQAVRTGVRPESAAGADGAPATGSAPATGQTPAPSGATPAGATPPGAAPSLAKPATGQAPAQQVPPVAPPQQAPRPADATMPGPVSATQAVPPAAVAAPPPAAARAPQQPPAAQQQAGKQAKNRGNRGPRRARLQLRHVDTWSALKISLVLSIAMFFIWMVAVGILYGVLSGLGVFDTLNDLFGQLGTSSSGEGGGDVITPGIVFGGAAVIGAINIVLMTALCTVAAFIYNLCADLVGGLEVTLAERD